MPKKLARSGFVRHAFEFAQTQGQDPLIGVVKKLEELARRDLISHKDPLSIATVYPLLLLCRERDFLSDGMIMIF